MKVSCMEYPESIEIDEKDIIYEKIITSFKCPKCDGKAYLKEVDVFVCWDCDLVWSVD